VTEFRRRDSEPPLPTGWQRPFVQFYRRNGMRGVVIVMAVLAVVVGAGTLSLVTWSTAGHRISAASGRYNTLVPHGWDFQVDCQDAPFTLPEANGPIKDADITCLRPDPKAPAGVYLDLVYLDQSTSPALATVTDSIANQLSRYSPCEPPMTPTEDGPTEVVCLQRTGSTEAGVLRVRIFGTIALIEVCAHTDEPPIAAECVNVWRGVQVSD
jgi:uncharacterized protein YceK